MDKTFAHHLLDKLIIVMNTSSLMNHSSISIHSSFYRSASAVHTERLTSVSKMSCQHLPGSIMSKHMSICPQPGSRTTCTDRMPRLQSASPKRTDEEHGTVMSGSPCNRCIGGSLKQRPHVQKCI